MAVGLKVQSVRKFLLYALGKISRVILGVPERIPSPLCMMNDEVSTSVLDHPS